MSTSYFNVKRGNCVVPGTDVKVGDYIGIAHDDHEEVCYLAVRLKHLEEFVRVNGLLNDSIGCRVSFVSSKGPNALYLGVHKEIIVLKDGK